MQHRRTPVPGLARILATTAVIAIATPGLADDRPDLRIAVTKLTPHLDPMESNSNANERISQNLVENLIQYDPQTGEFQPGLATAWRLIDETTLELDIRQGVKCHNGEDFTTEDVAYMFGPARYLAKDAPGHDLAHQFLNTITAVEAVDTHTVHISTG